MTISSKLVDINGLEFAVSEDTDTVDVGGFSDSILTPSAITAQFSDLATMQANSGKRIGMTQLKIKTNALNPPTLTEVVAPLVNTFEVGTDGDPNQFRDQDTAADISLTTFLNNESFRIYDLNTSTSKTIDVTMSEDSTDEIFNVLNKRASLGSNDCGIVRKKINSNYTRLWDVDESDDITFTVGVTNLLSDVATAAVTNIPTTKRYLRFTEKKDVGFSTSNTNEGNENNCLGSNCTVPTGCCVSGCGGMTKTDRNIPNNVFTSIINADLTTTVTVKVRSSISSNTADGTVLITDQVMNASETLTFDTDLLLTGEPSGDFVTLEVVAGDQVPAFLDEITSIKEV